MILTQFSLFAGVHNMMYAHQTYVPAPIQQSAPILSVDRTNTTANSLEQTVPLLHEAHTAKDILVGAYKTAHHQVASALLLAFSVDSRLVLMHPPEWLSRVPQHLTITHPACCACDHSHAHRACGLWRPRSQIRNLIERGFAWRRLSPGPPCCSPGCPLRPACPVPAQRSSALRQRCTRTGSRGACSSSTLASSRCTLRSSSAKSRLSPLVSTL